MIKVHRNSPSKYHLARVTLKRFIGGGLEIIKAEPIDEVEGETFNDTLQRAMGSTMDFNAAEVESESPEGLNRKKYYDKDSGKYYILVQNIHKTDADDVVIPKAGNPYNNME